MKGRVGDIVWKILEISSSQIPDGPPLRGSQAGDDANIFPFDKGSAPMEASNFAFSSEIFLSFTNVGRFIVRSETCLVAMVS